MKCDPGDHLFAVFRVGVLQGPREGCLGGTLGHFGGETTQEKILVRPVLKGLDPGFGYGWTLAVVALGEFLVKIAAKAAVNLPGPRIDLFGRELRPDGVGVGGPFDRARMYLERESIQE